MQLKQRDKSKKREAILKGAEDVFLSMGYKDASMDAIASEAGISKKTVYNHFQSKENLFEAIVDNLLEERQVMKSIFYDKEKTLEEQLMIFAESEINLINTPEKLRVSRFLTITFLNDLPFQRRVVAKYPPVHSTFIDWLQEAVQDNKIQTDNILMTARIFFSLVIGGITWPVLFTNDLEKKSTSEMLSEIISTFLAKYRNNSN